MERIMEMKTTEDTKDRTPETPEEVESPVESAEKVLDDVNEETGEVLGVDEETLKTAQELDGDDPGRKEVEDGTREVASKTVESRDEAKEEIDEIVGSESDRRREEWKNETDKDKKKEEIERYREGLKGDAEAILAEGESIEDCIKRLREDLTEFASKTAEAAGKLEGQTEGLGQEEAREAIRDLAKSTKNNLDVAKLNYLLIPEVDLLDKHKDKEITIENLEEMANDLENLENFLVEFEGKSEEKKKEAQEEALAFADLVIKLAKDPRTLEILKVAGVIVGVLTILTALGLGGHALFAGVAALGITTEQAAIGTALGAAAVGGYLFSSKEQRERAKEYGKIAAGGVIGAGILGLGWLLNEEKWDKFMKGASKENYPAWYHFFKELFGLPKEGETSKS